MDGWRELVDLCSFFKTPVSYRTREEERTCRAYGINTTLKGWTDVHEEDRKGERTWRSKGRREQWLMIDGFD